MQIIAFLKCRETKIRHIQWRKIEIRVSHCTPSQSRGQQSIIQGGGWGEQIFMDTVGIGVRESKASILHQTRLQNQEKTKCTLKYACCHLCFCVFFWKPLIKYLLKMFL